jgi:hypothetical protein
MGLVPDEGAVEQFVAGVFYVHDEVAGGLGHPGGGRRCGGAEDANPAGGMLDRCGGRTSGRRSSTRHLAVWPTQLRE